MTTIVNSIYRYKGKDLNFTQTAILIRMALSASERGCGFISCPYTLAEHLKCSMSTIQKAIDHFKERGFLILERDDYVINPKKLGFEIPK